VGVISHLITIMTTTKNSLFENMLCLTIAKNVHVGGPTVDGYACVSFKFLSGTSSGETHVEIFSVFAMETRVAAVRIRPGSAAAPACRHEHYYPKTARAS
jgi:hypothetical protein